MWLNPSWEQTQRLSKKKKKKTHPKSTPQKKPWHRNLARFWSSWNICWEKWLEDWLTHWKMQLTGLDLKENPFCTGEFMLFFCPTFLWQCLGGQYHCHHQCWRGKDRVLCENARSFCSWKLYFVLILLSQISVQRLNYVGNNLTTEIAKASNPIPGFAQHFHISSVLLPQSDSVINDKSNKEGALQSIMVWSGCGLLSAGFLSRLSFI